MRQPVSLNHAPDISIRETGTALDHKHERPARVRKPFYVEFPIICHHQRLGNLFQSILSGRQERRFVRGTQDTPRKRDHQPTSLFFHCCELCRICLCINRSLRRPPQRHGSSMWTVLYQLPGRSHTLRRVQPAEYFHPTLRCSHGSLNPPIMLWCNLIFNSYYPRTENLFGNLDQRTKVKLHILWAERLYL